MYYYLYSELMNYLISKKSHPKICCVDHSIIIFLTFSVSRVLTLLKLSTEKITGLLSAVIKENRPRLESTEIEINLLFLS